MRMPTSCPARISAASRRCRPRLTSPLRETGRSTSTARVPAACCGSGDGPAGTAPLAASLVRSAGDRWERRVLIRMPPAGLAPELLSPWVVEADGPVEPAASEVLRVFHSYGWPAIQAALDNPGYPRDPTVRWPRTFPKIPRGPRFDDEIEAEERSRAELEEIMERADSDPRGFQDLLAFLETDPDPAIRQGAAWWLLRRANEERSRQALQAAAAEDEDIEVRWIARYALRLGERGVASQTTV